MNKISDNQDKPNLNIFLLLFLGFVILRHLGNIFKNLIYLLQPQSDFYTIDKNLVGYSIFMSIAMIIVVIGTMRKKKWGVIGFFCFQIINLIGIQALSKEQQDLSFHFGVTCFLCLFFALLLLLRSNGKSAWKVIFEPTASKPKKNYFFWLRNLHWFRRKDRTISKKVCVIKRYNIFKNKSSSNKNVIETSGIKNEIRKGKRKHLLKVILIAISAIVIVSMGVCAYFLYTHYTSNEYLMNKANETFRNGEIKKALGMYEELADKKDYVPAKSRLGYLYLINDSVTLDSVKGKKYLTEASVTDSISLRYLMKIYLGNIYKGKCYMNREKAKYYAEMAIERGILLGEAYFVLAVYSLNNDDAASAYYYFEKSSEYKFARAFAGLGLMTYYGDCGIIDMNKSYRYIEKALKIDPKDDLALYQMGLFYLDGEVVKKDKLKARDYFKQAADLGNEDAKAEYSKIQFEFPYSDFSLDNP